MWWSISRGHIVFSLLTYISSDLMDWIVSHELMKQTNCFYLGSHPLPTEPLYRTPLQNTSMAPNKLSNNLSISLKVRWLKRHSFGSSISTYLPTESHGYVGSYYFLRRHTQIRAITIYILLIQCDQLHQRHFEFRNIVDPPYGHVWKIANVQCLFRRRKPVYEWDTDSVLP